MHTLPYPALVLSLRLQSPWSVAAHVHWLGGSHGFRSLQSLCLSGNDLSDTPKPRLAVAVASQLAFQEWESSPWLSPSLSLFLF